MSATPRLFISFSSKDQARIRRLFAALEVQEISVWDYSDQGQELGVGRDLLASLTEKIDLCEHFIAIISPSSIDQELSKAPYLEVRHAIDAGKLAHKRILPVLVDNPSSEWLSLYPELEPILRITLEDDSEERVEDATRRICNWLKVSYAPSSLKDNRVFFTKLFLEEIHGQKLGNADFVQLLRIMNSCARKMLADDWEGAKEKTSLFLGLVREMVPEATFQYPLVIKGVCELQLKQFANAERTFLQATTNHDISSNPLLGLGYAGLGQTYAAQQRFDESLLAFQKAVEQEGADQYLRFNHQVAIFSVGGLTLDESVLDGFDLTKLSLDERRRLVTLKGGIQYRKGNFPEAISAFSGLECNDLDEASAIYYALALQENGDFEKAFEILSVVGARTRSPNVFHHLADAYLTAGDLCSASRIYEGHLCALTEPTAYARQLLVEYAQIIRLVKGDNSAEFRHACERVVDFEVFPPPQSKADCFFIGFAYHLLGKNDLAKHYYAISSGFSVQYYDRLECNLSSKSEPEMKTVDNQHPTENGSGRPQARLDDVTKMWLWLVAGFVIMIGVGGTRILLEHWNLLPSFVKSGLNPVVLTGATSYCVYMAKRHYARSRGPSAADDLMKMDPRPPIVYLRPFAADAKEGIPRWLHTETQEEKLASVFANVGPLVAFGKPHEKFPTLGVPKNYVERDWEKALIKLMSRARLVVVRAGKGDKGLRFEIEHATQELKPEKLLIIIPSGRKNYEDFRSNFQQYFPHPLPEYPSWRTSRTRIKALICFDSEWRARLLTFNHSFLRGSIFNPLTRALQAALQPVYESIGIPWRSPSINWIRLGFMSLLVLAVLYGIYEGVS